MRLARPVRGLLATALLATGTAASGTSSATGAGPLGPVTPPGMTVVVDDAGWSWFEDRRVVFDADATTLYASAVASDLSVAEPPGSVLMSQLALASGARSTVILGVGPADDHNSASIWVAPDGELTTSWSLHNQNSRLQTHRRRTDGTWLALPSIAVDHTTTYSNLVSVAQEDGTQLLYDFFRGERFDPEVIASADSGRTWSSLGRVLKDPFDEATTRPYVQYRSTSPTRIDLIATEAHPDAQQTSIYHGYIEGGLVHRSDGAVLGPLGSAVPVTALTRVWAPTGDERGWTADLVGGAATGELTVAFSVRLSDNDHRYWTARLSGSMWEASEIAYAGSALYPGQPNYTGLVALDEADSDHLVISTNVDPTTGLPVPVASDGISHWELWDGLRQPDSTIVWTPLTSRSTVDNIRPVLVHHPSGASALLWMRGRYTKYADYDLDIVGVVHRADQSLVTASPTASRVPVRTILPAPAPSTARARPLVGSLDADGADDLLLYRAGLGREDELLGDLHQRATPTTPRQVNGTYTPIPGDYDANGTTDIYWYAPGPATDQNWWSTTGPLSDVAPVPFNL